LYTGFTIAATFCGSFRPIELPILDEVSKVEAQPVSSDTTKADAINFLISNSFSGLFDSTIV
jgi:hypothetical protein